MNISYSEEKQARLRREGTVDALVDCLALLQQDSLRRTLPARIAAAASSGDAGDSGSPGAHEGYLACRHWVAQGFDGEALAARILQHIFTIWPRETADYQLHYDEFLEKELENPRATYYPSSHEWMAAVESLRDDVMRARDLNQPPTAKMVRGCLKLLATHTPPSAATLPPAQSADPIPAPQHPHLID